MRGVVQVREAFPEGFGKGAGRKGSKQGIFTATAGIAAVQVPQMLPPGSSGFAVGVERMDPGNQNAGMAGHGGGHQIANAGAGWGRNAGGSLGSFRSRFRSHSQHFGSLSIDPGDLLAGQGMFPPRDLDKDFLFVIGHF